MPSSCIRSPLSVHCAPICFHQGKRVGRDPEDLQEYSLATPTYSRLCLARSGTPVHPQTVVAR